ncbi:sugar kinase [Lentilactobacillus hilgardii]|uniref:sugar kinase n=1 Tax=Lentilactobacillus hilgardii TaxID=1588 RepID=UPI0021C359D1|nr:sugar kinase [Lentilactobacillus hilgardii]MCP9333774.1 sugar kinase [Lentilactobacillus hilgardii]MCP9350353.1 sugar kinase [Lentilactobacillus hilgardii]MCP9353269.1 sugar kinase [Lentilactobacillus hilgardii]
MSVTTFDELMLRLTTHDTLRFSQVTYLETNFGGAETNVAVLLNQLGDQVTFVTKLPENNIADITINQLRGYEIDTSLIARGGDRMGLYFLQRGRGIRLISVTYDRAFSAFATPQKSDYDWGLLFMKINYFYISGITPTLSNELAQTVLDSAKYCHLHQIKVVYDANFRGKLWTSKTAMAFNRQILPYVNICFTHDEDLGPALGFSIEQLEATPFANRITEYKRSLERLTTNYLDLQIVATIVRDISTTSSRWISLLCQDRHFYQSPSYLIPTDHEVASGDAFGAWIIHGIINEFSTQEQLDYAMAAAIPSDSSLLSDKEIKAVVNKGDRNILR